MFISLFTLQLNELPLRQHLLLHPHTLLTVICVVVASVSTTTNGCSNFSHCVPVPVVASRLHTITGWRHDGRVRSVQVRAPGSRWQVGGFSGPRLLAAAGSSGAVLYTVHPHTAHSQTRTIHTSSYKTTGWSPTFTNPEDPHIHNDIATMMINRNVNKLSQTSRQYMDFYNIAGEVHNRQLNACIQRHSCCI